MTKVLVLYYSSYGHIETLANAVAEGVKSVDGVEVTIKRVPELVPEEVAKNAGIKLDQAAPIASPNELARSEEHTSELQSRPHLVCRLLLEKKKKKKTEL